VVQKSNRRTIVIRLIHAVWQMPTPEISVDDDIALLVSCALIIARAFFGSVFSPQLNSLRSIEVDIR
jgi:hypothetical protein